ncbi:MAG: hypothetical protein AAGH15_02130 [Myxococcota bacterium]
MRFRGSVVVESWVCSVLVIGCGSARVVTTGTEPVAVVPTAAPDGRPICESVRLGLARNAGLEDDRLERLVVGDPGEALPVEAAEAVEQALARCGRGWEAAQLRVFDLLDSDPEGAEAGGCADVGFSEPPTQVLALVDPNAGDDSYDAKLSGSLLTVTGSGCTSIGEGGGCSTERTRVDLDRCAYLSVTVFEPGCASLIGQAQVDTGGRPEAIPRLLGDWIRFGDRTRAEDGVGALLEEARESLYSEPEMDLCRREFCLRPRFRLPPWVPGPPMASGRGFTAWPGRGRDIGERLYMLVGPHAEPYRIGRIGPYDVYEVALGHFSYARSLYDRHADRHRWVTGLLSEMECDAEYGLPPVPPPRPDPNRAIPAGQAGPFLWFDWAFVDLEQGWGSVVVTRQNNPLSADSPLGRTVGRALRADHARHAP